jgi:hypothetical protein
MPLKRDDLPGILISSAEKVQRAFLDHFQAKPKPKRAAAPAPAKAAKPAAPAKNGGVDASKSKAALLEDAKAAGIAGRTKMSKDELIAALEAARAK